MKLLKSIIPLFVLASLGLSVTPLTTVQAANKTIKVQNALSTSNNSLNVTYKANNEADTASASTSSSS